MVWENGLALDFDFAVLVSLNLLGSITVGAVFFFNFLVEELRHLLYY